MLYNEAERWRLVYMYVCVCVCMYLFVKAKLIKGRQACVVTLWSQLGHGTAISQQIVCVRSHFFFKNGSVNKPSTSSSLPEAIMVSHQHTAFIFAFHQTCFPSPFLLLSLLPLLSISMGKETNLRPWKPALKKKCMPQLTTTTDKISAGNPGKCKETNIFFT